MYSRQQEISLHHFWRLVALGEDSIRQLGDVIPQWFDEMSALRTVGGNDIGESGAEEGRDVAEKV